MYSCHPALCCGLSDRPGMPDSHVVTEGGGPSFPGPGRWRRGGCTHVLQQLDPWEP